jgi:hypothetical protein
VPSTCARRPPKRWGALRLTGTSDESPAACAAGVAPRGHTRRRDGRRSGIRSERLRFERHRVCGGAASLINLPRVGERAGTGLITPSPAALEMYMADKPSLCERCVADESRPAAHEEPSRLLPPPRAEEVRHARLLPPPGAAEVRPDRLLPPQVAADVRQEEPTPGASDELEETWTASAIETTGGRLCLGTLPEGRLLRFNGQLAGVPAVFMIDSGASSDFVSAAFEAAPTGPRRIGCAAGGAHGGRHSP